MEGIEIEVPDREEAACALDTVEARLVRQGQYDAACDVINAKRRIRLDEEEIAALEDQLAERDAEIERLKGELETERIRLAACGAAALGYDDPPIDRKNPYWSASYGDVQTMRAEIERLRAELALRKDYADQCRAQDATIHRLKLELDAYERAVREARDGE